MKKIIQVDHLTKSFGSRFNQNKILDNLSFSVEKGEFVGIMGPSGAGKTTLMNLLATITLPTLGSITIADEQITKMTEDERSRFRRNKIGFIFQDFNLLETLNVQDNISLPLAIEHLGPKEIESRVKEVTKMLGIDHLLLRYPNELSIGQKQRVAASRAIVKKPKVVFADEPTGSLDSKAATELLNYLVEINQTQATTILMVTHDPFTASYCDRILFLKDGVFFSEVVRRGSRKEFFDQVIDMQATIGGGGRMNAR
ncbi:ABC transporter ATP-binding protein [uncultured Enterococcus sp.]|uniref:ABC transporter ATP-binding protein n=1 Tax=uncultured Enterococcus sp. TaxID=167972 RepID=UPI0025E36387|nr:ABC transporter ATP-binding protein [uncultured Enterococcus sp.]